MTIGAGWTGVSRWFFPLRLVVFMGGLVLLWAPLALIIYHWLPVAQEVIWLVLYGILMAGLWQWAARVRRQAKPFKSYGFTGSPAFYLELVRGVGVAWAGLLLLFGTESMAGWLTWRVVDGRALLLNGILSLALGAAVAVAEELLFRGWILQELALDYGMRWSIQLSALIFAVAHFFRPWDEIVATWLQFPGLWLGGWAFARARQITWGRLGLPIGLHGGWVSGIALINNLDWIRYTGVVPEWVTGIGQNPLAGLSGLILLSGIVMLLHGKGWRLSDSTESQANEVITPAGSKRSSD